MMLPLLPVLGGAWNVPGSGLSTWGAILGLALLSTAAAYLIYFPHSGERRGRPTCSWSPSTIPVSAIVLGAGLLG